ncbi:putative manganese lipoxygenase protein [Phaeoacremonium minimum UCRPA7]|uniref:Manganese lipoxygenase n=1 Tax=Phaeoacremonium minimum (strain UCR-PA7) TaxID=1286976 RepID=R8BXL7_PHAM7|nr:putative manganese lipoxygenase protein [Phaeoacremonium minimum UCRPA7]EOO04024.1 putative manganese lipoxygenase protein [Phaeoacremonium minimum UCRPA7]
MPIIVLVSASAIPAVTKTERDSPTDLIDELVGDMLARFQSSVPIPSENGTSLLAQLLSALEGESYSIATESSDPIIRAANLDIIRDAFLYGDAVGGGPYYPSGILGIAKDVLDITNIQLDLTPQILLAINDSKQAILDAAKYNGLQTLDDYVTLYDGEWINSLPNGPDLGVQTNYTQDLFFSMQRLSNSPYQIRRLRKGSDELEFTIDTTTASEISGMSLEKLLEEGRLFYADYRDQIGLESTGRFAALCDAYFYIDATSGDFLPLAIRTNVGSNLVYTPLDSPNDWLLAKMMYNVNDFWFAQWNHLAATHEVVQIVWMAGIRSLSREHPVYAILNRVTYQLFAIQILAEAVLFNSGGAVDLVFPYSGQAAKNYTTNRYNNGAGQFKANYFKTDLKSRGLIDYCHGPRIKNFPFYQDAGVIYDAIHTFMTSFVKSYYSSDSEVASDQEIQAWVEECNGAAQVFDFPSEISSIDTLIDVLTHVPGASGLIGTSRSQHERTSSSLEHIAIQSTISL